MFPLTLSLGVERGIKEGTIIEVRVYGEGSY